MRELGSRFWIALVALVLMTSAAWAGIPPETEEEMEALANIVVEATVVEVVVVGVTEVPNELQRVHMEATLAVNYDHMGGAPASLVIPFDWDFIQPQDFLSCGFTEPAHWVGEQAKYYLWGPGDGTYGLVSYDAMFELDESEPQPWTGDEILAAAYPEEEPVEWNPGLPLTQEAVPVPTTETGEAAAGCSLATRHTTGYGVVLFGLMLLLGFRRQRLSH